MSEFRLSISVIILASRPDSLRRGLAALARAQPPDQFECLLALNGNIESCESVANEFRFSLPGLRLIRPGRRSLGGARNAAIREACGDWLCFLDDDVVVPPHYFTVLNEKVSKFPIAAVIGGPNLTPVGSSLFQRCVGASLASTLCAGPMSKRYKAHGRDAWTDDRSLILCNLCLRRDILLSDGVLFDEDLVRNEENLLLEQFFERGRKALHAPQLCVDHERRSTFLGACRQVFLSGQGRLEMTLKRPASLRALHLAPLLVLAGIPGLFLAPRLILPAAGLYALTAFAHSCILAWRDEETARALPRLLILVPAFHLSYAAGFIAGALLALSRSRAAKLTPASSEALPVAQ